MRIALDARWIFEQMSGIGAYTAELIRALASVDRENEYVLLFNRASLRDRTVRDLRLGDAANVHTRVVPYGVFSPVGQWAMPRILRRLEADLYHSPNYMIPLLAFPRNRRGRLACVVTIHDVIPMIFPHHAPRSRKSRLFPLYRRLMREVGVRSHVIVTDSEASRRDVIRHLRMPSEREGSVRAVHCGVSSRFRPPPAESRRGSASGDPARVLYVGRSDPYKNLVRLVEAFAAARSRCPFAARLLLAGPPDARYPEAGARAVALGLGDAVRWTGYLPDADLVRLYQQARVLVMPSLYEGFGLPVIEAMACGTPVVCSRIGALEEVAGDAALFVDPESVPDMAGAIGRVLTEPALASDLSARGLRRAAGFTWEATARRTLELYREAVAGAGR